MSTTGDIGAVNTEDAHNRNIKNFRSSADVENFYRFISENRLRREAQMALEAICNRMKALQKKGKRKRKKKVLQ